MRKIILKYILMYMPFIIGILLYSFSIYNIVSSLLLFLGGYIAIKNTFDYRKIKRNINMVNLVDRKIGNSKCVYNNVGVRKIRKYSRVRKRIKQ